MATQGSWAPLLQRNAHARSRLPYPNCVVIFVSAGKSARVLDQGRRGQALAPLKLPQHILDLLPAIDRVDDRIHDPDFVTEQEN